MLTVLGSLLGFAGSAVPSVIEYFTKKQENKKQIELARVQAELAQQNADIDLTKFQMRAVDDEHS